MSKSVSLVLGSGGARGLAHIGIIKWLEAHDYLIESISGCSMGALIGGIYATGKLDAYTQARMKLSAYPPDIEIEIPRNLCGTLEFNRAKVIIDHGYKKCDEVFQYRAELAND